MKMAGVFYFQGFPRWLPAVLIAVMVTSLNGNPDALRRYVGHWKGSYQVGSLDGVVHDSLAMEQIYYWWRGELRGETAVQLPDGSVQFEFSALEIDGTVCRLIVEGASSKRRYMGWFDGHGLWWMNALGEEVLHYQLYREYLLPTVRGIAIRVEGYQWSSNRERPGFTTITGELTRMEEGEAFELFGER
jgi:hypothetical protein